MRRSALTPADAAGRRDIGEIIGDAGMVESGDRIATASDRDQPAFAGSLGGVPFSASTEPAR